MVINIAALEDGSKRIPRLHRKGFLAVADGMQRARAAERTPDLITSYGFSNVVDNNQRCPGSIPQPEQRLTERRHRVSCVRGSVGQSPASNW